MKTTEEGNKLIAEFMEWPTKKTCAHCKAISKYSTSWDWLMPVVEKIGELTEYELVFRYDESYWNRYGENPLNQFFGGYIDVLNIWAAVVKFIEWYNTQNK